MYAEVTMNPSIAMVGWPVIPESSEMVPREIEAQPASNPLKPARRLEKFADVVIAKGTATRG